MRLVLSETDTGVWLQLEGESAEEWARLEARAASDIWTCGPGTDAVLIRLPAIAGEIAPGFRHAWGGPERGVGLGEFLREWPGEEGGR
jgi:hypothetical protein